MAISRGREGGREGGVRRGGRILVGGGHWLDKDDFAAWVRGLVYIDQGSYCNTNQTTRSVCIDPTKLKRRRMKDVLMNILLFGGGRRRG